MIAESVVDDVLAHPFDHAWTIQGFGMLRTYLDDAEVHRLHIWDVDAAVPEVSVIHDHPWDFDSQIYRGAVINQRYRFADDVDSGITVPMRVGRIKTGEGGGLVDPASIHDAWLAVPDAEEYGPGDSYHMDAPELHESVPSRGAVTVIARRFHTARDDQFATVCWGAGDWVSAEPRPATRAEIEHFVALARGAF